MANSLCDKLYYKIGEVARMASLKPSVLRFWETEFNQLKPKKSTSGQRLYSNTDIELVLTIRKLLYNEKLTIEGARRKIALYVRPKKLLTEQESTENETLQENSLLQEIKRDLLLCRQILEG
jgi:DNA-binding transcriptional MerR regulator